MSSEFNFSFGLLSHFLIFNFNKNQNAKYRYFRCARQRQRNAE